MVWSEKENKTLLNVFDFFFMMIHVEFFIVTNLHISYTEEVFKSKKGI